MGWTVHDFPPGAPVPTASDMCCWLIGCSVPLNHKAQIKSGLVAWPDALPQSG